MAPAETTITGVRASSSRSAEMSKLSSAPLCTPPMPPVAKTLMPARLRRDHGGGDRRAAGAALGDRKGKVGARQLHGAAGLGQRLALFAREADLDAARR